MNANPRSQPHAAIIIPLACLIIIAGLGVAWWITSRPIASLAAAYQGNEYTFELTEEGTQLFIDIYRDTGARESSSSTAITATLNGAEDAWVEQLMAQGKHKDAEFVLDEQTGEVELRIGDRHWRYDFGAKHWEPL